MLHDFGSSNAWSKSKRLEEVWGKLYSSAFRDRLVRTENVDDLPRQLLGIDKELYLRGGKVLLVDEKSRASKYPDVLIEVFSSFEDRTPGWARKDLHCDLIAYGWFPFGKPPEAILLPFQALRTWFDRRGWRWYWTAARRKDGARICDAHNQGYTTRSIAIPTERLLDEIRDSMVVTI